MLGENDVTASDRMLTLFKAAGYCIFYLAMAGLAIAIFGYVVS